MNPFECCRECVAPKRYPGCGSTCTEYKEACKKWVAQKALIKSERDKQRIIQSVRTRCDKIRKPKD